MYVLFPLLFPVTIESDKSPKRSSLSLFTQQTPQISSAVAKPGATQEHIVAAEPFQPGKAGSSLKQRTPRGQTLKICFCLEQYCMLARLLDG